MKKNWVKTYYGTWINLEWFRVLTINYEEDCCTVCCESDECSLEIMSFIGDKRIDEAQSFMDLIFMEEK